MSKELENWLPHAGTTLDTVLDAPRGLYERLFFISEILGATGPLPSPPVLLYRGSDTTVRAVLVAGGLTVGREAPSGLVITDPKLSRLHFRIVCDAGRAILTDEQSRNGTYINGQRTKKRELRNGDIIQAGDQVLVFLNTD
jgi:pSer/pThr/pTyr-binding forkhead associated (FHA) protein